MPRAWNLNCTIAATVRKQVEGTGVDSVWTITANAAEYRERVAIEQRLKDTPAAAQDWLRHQLKYAATDEMIEQPEEV
ncbi:MAG: chromosome segregation ATPase [Burkholderia sp.]|nr:chromosome segregation ATPase [Burkholderia sp.]